MHPPEGSGGCICIHPKVRVDAFASTRRFGWMHRHWGDSSMLHSNEILQFSLLQTDNFRYFWSIPYPAAPSLWRCEGHFGGGSPPPATLTPIPPPRPPPKMAAAAQLLDLPRSSACIMMFTGSMSARGTSTRHPLRSSRW